MPKQPKSVLISSYIVKKPYTVFEKFNANVKCKICAVEVNVRTGHVKQSLDEHLRKQAHVKKSQSGLLQTSIETAASAQQERARHLDAFNLDFTKAFLGM